MAKVQKSKKSSQKTASRPAKQAKAPAKPKAAAGTARKAADCRLFPSVNNCSLFISGTEGEVLKVAVQHAVDSHGHMDTPELRAQIRALLRDEK